MPHLKDFFAAFPDIKVDVTLTDATVDLIDTGMDVAVRIGALTTSTLMARRLASHQRRVVASPDYLAKGPPVQKPDDLFQHQCLPFALQPADAWYFLHLDDPAVEPLEVKIGAHLRVNDSEALLGAALAGLGIALLPTWLVGEDIRAGRLVTLLPEWEARISLGPERAIWGVYPPKKIVSPKVRAFLAFLAQRFGNPPYWEDLVKEAPHD
jgi:DNA-binding transcriptional LysR family regulator